MVVFLLQEVGEGYLDATCGRDHSRSDDAASSDSKDQVFKSVRRGMYEFLTKNCQSTEENDKSATLDLDYDVSCEDMHGKIGTKSKFGHLTDRVNSQIAVVFNKKTNGTPKYHIEIHKKQLTYTEKGGIIVEIEGNGEGHGEVTPKAAVIGVHLDSSDEEERNLQICRIMKNLLKLSGKVADFKFKCKNEHSNPNIMYDLGTMITELYPLGVYWTGDSNYRLPVTTFTSLNVPVCPIDDDSDCKCKKNLIGSKTKKKKHCFPGKAKIITQLAKLGCGDPEALTYYKNGDRKILKKSTLTLMGATVNQPYPQFPPR